APSFTPSIEVVAVRPDMAPVVVMLALEGVLQEVTVSAEEEEIADPTMSLTSLMLSGDSLLDLPTDEEELARYLLMLAGADTTGDLEDDILANFIIDGFDNGRLPRADRISQVIIDPNSLS